MATPLADLLTAVPSLNVPQQPFTFAVEGGRIVGRWDIVKATSLYPTEITHLDKDYRIEVELDEGDHVYDYEDHTSDTSGSVSADDGTVTAGFQKEFFKGKTKSKEFSFEFGGINKTDEGVSMDPVVYSFDTDRIKEPLFAFLEHHGWSKKKGFLSRLFS